jgi:hypothetical protein
VTTKSAVTLPAAPAAIPAPATLAIGLAAVPLLVISKFPCPMPSKPVVIPSPFMLIPGGPVIWLPVTLITLVAEPGTP